MSLQPNSGRIGAQLRDRARHSPSQSLRFWQDLPASRVRFTQLRADEPGTGDQLPPRRSQATCSSVFSTAGTAGTSAAFTGAASSGTGTAGGTATGAGPAPGAPCPAAPATVADAGAGKAVTVIGPPTIGPPATAAGEETGVSPPFCQGSAIWQAASPVNSRTARTRRMASLRKTAVQARPERPVRCKWADASRPIRTAPDRPGAAPRSPPAPRATASPLPPRYCCAADPSWWPR